MDSTDENYLQKITELIQDDNTIVTCISFSGICKLKVSYVQNILDKYAELKQNDISSTYIIVGTNEIGGISVLLSNENELEKTKTTLKTIVSQHVYSIQKKNIDLCTLQNVDSFSRDNILKEPLLGSVVSSKAVKRKIKKSVKTINSDTDTKQEKQQVDTKQNKVVESENAKLKKSSLKSFFTAGSNQHNGITSKTSAKQKPKGLMANFLSKSNGNMKESNTDGNKINDNLEKQEEKVDIEDVHEDDCKEVMEVDTELISESKSKLESSKSQEKTKQDTLKRNKKSKKRPADNKNEQPHKKRKRIVETQDSDSDIFASSESEVEVVPDINSYCDNFEEETVEPTAAAVSKSRKMKQMTEEFMDEDGYMNTIEKYIMISDEEDKEQKSNNIIEEVIEKPVVKTKEVLTLSPKKDSSPPKKVSKHGKGKALKPAQNQRSIMSFFKKT